MFDALLTLPPYLLSLIAAALLGIVGIVLSLTVARRRPGIARVLPIALFALGYGLADRFVVPDLVKSDAALCALANEQARGADHAIGTTEEQGIAFGGTAADCATKTLTDTYSAPADAAIDPEGKANAEAAFTADTCGDPELRKLVENGWSVRQEFSMGAGAPVVIEAAC